MKHISSSNILVVGLARNCSKYLENDIARISTAFTDAKKLQFLIIESDSSDESVACLESKSKSVDNFSYETLGELRHKHPKRTDRIAKCRNRYVELLNESRCYADVDFVVIADLDGINNSLTRESVLSCWSRLDWDVCTANQIGPYYDIWALRHPLWSPNDCWAQANYLMQNGCSQFKAILSSVYSRMITIQTQCNWIEVDSAFGGLAIYKKDYIKKVKYFGLTQDGIEFCEHVSAHQQIKNMGGRIFINPTFINGSKVEHSRFATPHGLILLWVRIFLVDLAKRCGLATHLKRLVK